MKGCILGIFHLCYWYLLPQLAILSSWFVQIDAVAVQLSMHWGFRCLIWSQRCWLQVCIQGVRGKWEPGLLLLQPEFWTKFSFPVFLPYFVFNFREDQAIWQLWVWFVFKAKFLLILLKGSSKASLVLFPCAEQFLVPSALRGISSSANLWVFHRELDFPFTCSKCTRRWCCAGLKSTLRLAALLSSVIKNLTTPPAETLCPFEGSVNVNN